MSADATTAAVPTSEGAAPRDYEKLALTVGIAGLGVTLVAGLAAGGGHDPARPLLSWLFGFAYWFSLGVGMLMFTMLTYLFDAGWSVVVRRQLEHALAGFKWLAAIFFPLLLIALWKGLPWYWLHGSAEVPGGHGTVDNDTLLQLKRAFLNPYAFVGYSLLFFGVFIGLAESLRRHSFALDEDGLHGHVHFLRKLSAGGVIAHALALTFGAIIWFKALEPHWFSTMYGVWFFAASMWSGFAATIIILYLLSTRGYLRGIARRSHFYLLSCLLLAFTVFWAYISFSQYFLVYHANLPEETFWYNIRELFIDANLNTHKSGWWTVSMILIFGHFFIPFLLLLWYNNKFEKRIVAIAVYVLFIHLFDIYWNVLPGRVLDHDGHPLGWHARGFTSPWMLLDAAAWLGVGGICIWAFLRSSKQTKPIPVKDPRILESLNAHE